MPYKDVNGVLVWGEPELPAVEQMKRCLTIDPEATLEIAQRGALMADHHLGYSMPIGGVVSYRDHVSPSGVGYDIACGNKAVKTNLTWADIEQDLDALLDDIQYKISFGLGRDNKEPLDDHPLFDKDSHPAWGIPEINLLKRNAQAQLGTVGTGNHYVDILVEAAVYCQACGTATAYGECPEHEGMGVQISPGSPVWIGVHFGSRGLGHKIATGFLKLGKGQQWDDRSRGETMQDYPVMLDTRTDLGQAYLEAMDLAGVYAYAGRDYVCTKVAQILGAHEYESVHNHHNYAWLEEHDDEKVWVVRKGATPAYPGQQGFIGGSMGDISVLVEGVESVESQAALNSTVHGAGRVMSRTQAAGKMNYKTRERSGGQVTPEMMRDAVARFDVKLRGGGTDESPFVYRKLRTVLEAHRDSLRVQRVLKPVGVVMAGEDVVDPYKD